MTYTTHTGRITGPVLYRGKEGGEAMIPLGPCLVEQHNGLSVDIFWGEDGDETAALSSDAIRVAEICGSLTVLD